MPEANLRRRRFLVVAGTATIAGLAGCTAGSQSARNQLGDHGSTRAPATETAHSEGEDVHADDDHEEESEDRHDDVKVEYADDGHGGHDDHAHGHDEVVGDPVELAEVGMASTSSGEHFDPHVVRVKQGGTVRWTNESGAHTATAYSPAYDKPQLMPDGATPWDSGVLTDGGATFEHTFETEGVYHYYCAPHETMGMIGSVIVGEPDAHGQPALEEPPDDMPEPVREKVAELNEMCNQALGHTH